VFLNPLIITASIDKRVLHILRIELIGNQTACEIVKTHRFGLGQVFVSIPRENVLTELLVGSIRLIQALHRKVAELLGLGIHPVKSILDRYAIELRIEPLTYAGNADIETAGEIFRLEP